MFGEMFLCFGFLLVPSSNHPVEKKVAKRLKVKHTATGSRRSQERRKKDGRRGPAHHFQFLALKGLTPTPALRYAYQVHDDTTMSRSHTFSPLYAVTYALFMVLTASIRLLELEGSNFELALSSNRYAAILFYDVSAMGKRLESNWEKAAALLDEMHEEGEMAKINGADPELKELIDAYGITVPSVRVFRRGVMADYRGPLDGAVGSDTASKIAAYIKEDSQPSVQVASSLEEIKHLLSSSLRSVVLGFFAEGDLLEDMSEAYSISAWGQFQAAADSLRGHASFLVAISEDIRKSFKVKEVQQPVVYLINEDGEKLLPYTGEILEINLSEWVLRNSAPAMNELSLSYPSGELYATQFFSSRKLKFILFLRPTDLSSSPFAEEEEEEEEEVEEEEDAEEEMDVAADGSSSSRRRRSSSGHRKRRRSGATGRGGEIKESVVDAWRAVADAFKGKALFAYMVRDAVPDVLEYFNVDVSADLPLIVAHEPSQDFKYKSDTLQKGLDRTALSVFVSGVIGGSIGKMLKSEQVPASSKQVQAAGGKSSGVLRVVGSNVIQTVSTPQVDVLLMVFAPRCAHCKKLAPTYDILAKAVQGESRILITKIDGTANDLPSSWNVKGYPILLWFRAKDKPYADDVPRPKSYWDAGQSLHELVSFVQREGSFDVKTLRVATSEQLGSLLGDEQALRAQYDLEEHWQKRNDGRKVFEPAALDWVAGEVVFDGKRWHVLVTGLLALTTICLIGARLSAPAAPPSSSSSSSLSSATKKHTGEKRARAKAKENDSNNDNDDDDEGEDD